MRVLLTGAAGFIGFHVAESLLMSGSSVFGFDNHNDYYDPGLKEARVAKLQMHSKYVHRRGDICDFAALEKAFRQHRPDVVVHLAAQAGVRYSLTNPTLYVRTNVLGFQNVIDLVRAFGVDHFVYASSSSVYGERGGDPFKETDQTDLPVSLYAATKKSNEMVAHSYGKQFGTRSIGVRIFTAYGPYYRPDMAMYGFCDRILRREPIELFNQGRNVRDLTYVTDVAAGIVSAASKPFDAEIVNIGGGHAVPVTDLVSKLEEVLGIQAIRKNVDKQAGDVSYTSADLSKAREILHYLPCTSFDDGIRAFIDWFTQEELPRRNESLKSA